jgi:hypothetical protein
MKNKFWFRKIGMFLFFVPLALLVFGSVVMVLWNAILPAVIHVSTINFWQALGILLLSKILFGGFKGGWVGARRIAWKDEMGRKLANMTPEEKEKFKEDWRNRCSRWGRPNREEFRSARSESTNTAAD